VSCRRKKKTSVFEITERVELGGKSLPQLNLPFRAKQAFDPLNPFKLDLEALSKYQKQKHVLEEKEKRRNLEMIRRTMETKELRTIGAERIKQETRDEKFGMFKHFKVLDEKERVDSGGYQLFECLDRRSILSR
jgi:hypothetical protein